MDLFTVLSTVTKPFPAVTVTVTVTVKGLGIVSVLARSLNRANEGLMWAWK